MTLEELRELMAKEAHDSWSGWMEYLFSKSERNENGTVTVPKWAVERWDRQMRTDYADLLESEKNSDRFEADRYLAYAEQLKRERDAANKKLREIREELYGQGLRVLGWHLNGDEEPLDTWFESNDWEPVEGGQDE